MSITKDIRVIKYTSTRIKVFYRGTVLGYTTEADLDAFIRDFVG